jgi:hypothetical protein
MASKFKNIRVVVGGLKFDSKKEAARWIELCILLKAGKISHLARQVSFGLVDSVILDGRKKPQLKYIADAVYYDGSNKLVIEDTKSEITKKSAVYRIKKHLMMAIHGLAIKEV